MLHMTWWGWAILFSRDFIMSHSTVDWQIIFPSAHEEDGWSHIAAREVNLTFGHMIVDATHQKFLCWVCVSWPACKCFCITDPTAIWLTQKAFVLNLLQRTITLSPEPKSKKVSVDVSHKQNIRKLCSTSPWKLLGLSQPCSHWWIHEPLRQGLYLQGSAANQSDAKNCIWQMT